MSYPVCRIKIKNTDHIEPASGKDLEILRKTMNKALDSFEFQTPDKKLTQGKVWRRVFGKAMLTKREAFALIGFFTKISQTRREDLAPR